MSHFPKKLLTSSTLKFGYSSILKCKMMPRKLFLCCVLSLLCESEQENTNYSLIKGTLAFVSLYSVKFRLSRPKPAEISFFLL
mmetsp:Transcript_28815/g.37862  ORF Transcript_28815/g.37862 Transcript_28815/m.37862 type:complete len:83 (+) Transcript_28815:1832-2080(+)